MSKNSPYPPTIDFDKLWTLVEGQCLNGDSIHGPLHLKCVERNGLLLAEKTGADVDVVRLFALFHDSRRENDDRDEGHAARGADYVASLRGREFDLDDDRFNLLYAACKRHTDGKRSKNPTIATCWDADRLDICRGGYTLDPAHLSTEFGRQIAKHGSVKNFLESEPQFAARLQIAVPCREDETENCDEVNRRIGTALARIPRLHPRAIDVCQKLDRLDGKKQMPMDPLILGEFAKDFYSLYELDCGALSNFWGSALVLATFRALSPHWAYFANEMDVNAFSGFKDNLVVYRGGQGPEESLLKGFSWTLRKDIAISFARYMGKNSDPTVLRTNIPKDQVLAYTLEDAEVIIDPSTINSSEICVSHPRKLL